MKGGKVEKTGDGGVVTVSVDSKYDSKPFIIIRVFQIELNEMKENKTENEKKILGEVTLDLDGLVQGFKEHQLRTNPKSISNSNSNSNSTDRENDFVNQKFNLLHVDDGEGDSSRPPYCSTRIDFTFLQMCGKSIRKQNLQRNKKIK